MDEAQEQLVEEVQQEQPIEQPAPTKENINWKRMREENERYRKEAEDLKKQLSVSRGDEELVEYKQLKEMKKDLEQQLFDLKLKNKFPDFDSVVNSESLKQLEKDDPELLFAISSTTDPFAQAVAAYKMIKTKQPIVLEEPDEESDQFFMNQHKPRYTNSLEKKQSPLSEANAFQRGLTKEQKDYYYKEMVEAIKNKQ